MLDSLADHYEQHYLKTAHHVNGHKIFGLRDVARLKEFLKHFRAFFGKKRLREIGYVDLLIYLERWFKVQTQHKRHKDTRKLE